MNQILKDQILTNHFADQIRFLKIDTEEFERLEILMVQLASEWAGSDVIDKEIIADLYVTVVITLGAANKLRDLQSTEAAFQVEEMALRLDALLLACLTDEPRDSTSGA